MHMYRDNVTAFCQRNKLRAVAYSEGNIVIFNLKCVLLIAKKQPKAFNCAGFNSVHPSKHSLRQQPSTNVHAVYKIHYMLLSYKSFMYCTLLYNKW